MAWWYLPVTVRCRSAATPPATNVAELAHTLTDLFTQYVGDDLAGAKTNRATETIAQ